MGHLWLGFDRDQLTEWFAAAGMTAMRFADVPVDPFAMPGRPAAPERGRRVRPYDQLDRSISLFERVPEWRVLLRSCQWIRQDGVPVCLAGVDYSALETLLANLEQQCVELHAQPAHDEQQATSSAMRWPLKTLHIAYVEQVLAADWLESMPLVRFIRRRLASPW